MLRLLWDLAFLLKQLIYFHFINSLFGDSRLLSLITTFISEILKYYFLTHFGDNTVVISSFMGAICMFIFKIGNLSL